MIIPQYRLLWSRDMSVCRYRRLPMVSSGRDSRSVSQVRLRGWQLSFSFEDVPVPTPEELEALEARARVRAYEAMRQASKRLRIRIRGMGRKLVMVTLTVGGRRVRSREEMLSLFREFDREYLQGREFWSGDLVAVPEVHTSPIGEGGGSAWHIHFVMCLPAGRRKVPRRELDWLWRAWSRFLDGRGYPRSRSRDGSREVLHRVDVLLLPSLAASWYLSNYLTKSFGLELEREYYQHRWYSRRGQVLSYVVDGEALDFLRGCAVSSYECVLEDPKWGVLYFPVGASPPS